MRLDKASNSSAAACRDSGGSPRCHSGSATDAAFCGAPAGGSAGDGHEDGAAAPPDGQRQRRPSPQRYAGPCTARALQQSGAGGGGCAKCSAEASGARWRSRAGSWPAAQSALATRVGVSGLEQPAAGPDLGECNMKEAVPEAAMHRPGMEGVSTPGVICWATRGDSAATGPVSLMPPDHHQAAAGAAAGAAAVAATMRAGVGDTERRTAGGGGVCVRHSWLEGGAPTAGGHGAPPPPPTSKATCLGEARGGAARCPPLPSQGTEPCDGKRPSWRGDGG